MTHDRTMRERMLAIVRGEGVDRVPFCQYTNCGGPDEEVWSVIGRENMGLLAWGQVHLLAPPADRVEKTRFERDGQQVQRTVLHTAEGDLTEESFVESVYGTSHIERHFVQTLADYRRLNAHLREVQVVETMGRFEQQMAELGDDGFPFVSLGRTPFQQLWIQWVSIENLCLHLADAPEVVEETMDVMRGLQLQAMEIARKAAKRYGAPFVNFGDNITAPVIGEAYFRRYCVPMYDRMAEMLDGTGVPVAVHMDGDLKPLWAAIGESRVECLDSLSPPPDNDTRAADASELWSRMRLFVNFPSSVHLLEPDRIYARAMQILQEAGHTGRLWIQISENVPPGVWRTSYPEIVRATRDFGTP